MTLNDFIKKEIDELEKGQPSHFFDPDQPIDHATISSSSDAVTIEKDAIRAALRKAADHGFEHGWKAGCMPDCELIRDWDAYRGTNDQPQPPAFHPFLDEGTPLCGTCGEERDHIDHEV